MEASTNPSPLVTAEELAMLIGQIDPDEAQAIPSRRDAEDQS